MHHRCASPKAIAMTSAAMDKMRRTEQPNAMRHALRELILNSRKALFWMMVRGLATPFIRRKTHISLTASYRATLRRHIAP
jgi:hypothetical protein